MNMEFSAKLEGAVNVMVYNTAGQLVHTADLTAGAGSVHQLDLSKLSAGVYRLKMSNGDAVHNQNIVIR